MQPRKLRLDDLEVTSFTASAPASTDRGTVDAQMATPVCTGTDSCAVSCPNYTCLDWTCSRVPC